MKTPTNIVDAIAQANFPKVIAYTHALLRQIETEYSHIIIAASGVFFLALCERFKVRPQRVLEIIANMLQQEEQKNPKMIGGLRDFLSKEL